MVERLDEPDEFAESFTDAAVAAVDFLDAHEPGLDLWVVSYADGPVERVAAATGPWAARTPRGRAFRWLASGTASGGESGHEPLSGIGPGTLLGGDPLSAPVTVATPVRLPDDAVVGGVYGLAGETAGAAVASLDRAADFAARLLGSVAALCVRGGEELARRSSGDAGRDAETGLRGARSFADACRREEVRCDLFGVHASIVLVEVSSGPDTLVGSGRLVVSMSARERAQTCAGVLRTVCRPSDVLARLGEGTFAVLAPETDIVAAEALKVRLRKALRRAGLFVRLGCASRWPEEAMAQTRDRAGTMLRRDRRLLPLRPLPDL